MDKDGFFRGADGRQHRFYVYDKKTQKTWDVTNEGYVGMTYAAGGGSYGNLGNFGVYAVYDAEAERLRVYKYTFSKKENKQIGEVNQVEGEVSMMWAGKMVSVSYRDTSGKDNHAMLNL